MKRLLSLDFFRGLTIAAMIIVNDPGSWSYVYAPLRHAEWNGATPTDLVFPFFLFIVGVSISLSLSKRENSSNLYLKIFKRSIIIFLLGIFLALFPEFDFENLRVSIESLGHNISAAEISMIPKNSIKIEGKPAEHMLKMMEALEDCDDVQNVYSNFDIDDEVIEALT